MAVKKTVAADKAVETKAVEKKPAEKKTAAKRVCKKVNIELQYGEKSIDVAGLEGLAVAAWAEATGNAKTAAKSINLYIKPEDNMLYYVIEGTEGSVEL